MRAFRLLHPRRLRPLCTYAAAPPSTPSLLSDPDLLSLHTRLLPLALSRLPAATSPPNPLTHLTATSASLATELSDLLAIQADPSSDPDLLHLARDELATLSKRRASHAATLLTHLLLLHHISPPPTPSLLLEIRAGTGGQEAALFVADLLTMYTRLTHRLRCPLQELSRSPSPRAGLRQVILRLRPSPAVFRLLAAEAGVHRVQRVPATETQGRLHTSTASVAVLPEHAHTFAAARLDERDVKVDVYRASGAGGQHVNKTESAVRVTHVPTGLVATSQEDRSQHRNRALAMAELGARLAAKAAGELAAERTAERRAQLGATAGERSDRIRTYNWPQSRVTDHRIVPHRDVLALMPSAKDVLGEKSAPLAEVVAGGAALERVMEAVGRARDMDMLRELVVLADQVGVREQGGRQGGHRKGHKRRRAAA
ncbi:Peptide chain release factor RF1, mitochondrial [Chondrus crispus]|uniref:Peptide chain release factor RF1, mitochondrial n=1 Tax=Chondrus crispus TaxID=2769 RepID=R7Q6L0_CHOCR|nr:Peptide chain release factor RF1, mitochondrial [Chondrus crispus]CDF33669.1 Peptide chain release factor RF1, mitochondrial [Chondrus crispus]|eukprot:XP_005713488.1 Peptide chain release factor RF1, mitochondrial [Chondrus crispus]